jgi:uncharacterized protein YjbJ (UPF0337 family)
MVKNELQGTAKDVVGKLKDGAGGVSGDIGLQAEGKMDQLAGKMQKQFGNTADAISDNMQEAAAKVADMASDAGETVSHAAEQLRAQAADRGAQASAFAQRMGHEVENRVKHRPLMALLGMAVAGYAFAFLTHSPASPLARRAPDRRRG